MKAHKLARMLVAGGLALACALALPLTALAANDDKDITLGVFFTSETDWTDTVYASYDGERFYAIDTAYRDSGNHRYSGDHACHFDPGIVYHGGYYWMVSGWNRNDGKMWPMLSYSKDLVTWTHPEGDMLLEGDSTHGVSVDSLPTVNGAAYANFDTVAPKLIESEDGQLWLTFCAGYYGDFHGQHAQDQMQVYVAKVEQLSASDPSASGSYAWPARLVFKCGTARKATFSNYSGANYIDSNMYFENGTAYLLVKRDGLTEQIFSSTTPDDPASWQLVNARASWGYEGVSINKANGRYYLYGDGVLGTKPLGIRMVSSTSITRGDEWRDFRSGSELLHDPVFLSESGTRMSARHGDCITLKAGTSAWRTVKALLDPKVDAYFDFEDTAGHWGHDVILRAVKLGFMNGKGGDQAGLFSPEEHTTYEQAAAVLYNRLGNKAVVASQGKSDVLAGQWYTNGVNWALQNHVWDGVSASQFGIGQTIKREDFAIMIAHTRGVNDAQAAAVDTSVLSAYPDAAAIDDSARGYVAWAVQNKVMGGGPSLNARGPVTRAEMAAMLVNAADMQLL